MPITVASLPRRGALSATAQRLETRLRNQVGRAVMDYAMIREGDRIMVCVSGGNDSYAMLDLLIALRRAAPVRFELIAVNLEQKQPGFPVHVLPQYLDSRAIPWHVIEQDTYSVVKRVIPEGRTTCGLCSRLRRGALYRFAAENGISKIALGHHRDDILQTFFLNLFHGGRLKAMPPKLLSEDRKHIVIRPLTYCAEHDLERYARARDYPIIPCDLCGSQEHLQRNAIKQMLNAWEKESPGRAEVMFRALQQMSPSQLADRTLFDFAGLDALRDAGD